ncbi:MAG TPA: LssY C-terminal domain-containing protein [Terriglobales bacterium]|nr:LssY C-terminal domain-containing protein [Terriglobales bacterium]
MPNHPTGALCVVIFLAAALALPGATAAQLVREDATPSSVQSDATLPAQTSSPKGKKRFSQDFTLKGDSHWTDTKIDVRPGEQVVVTTSGRMRYLDAKTDNGPDGLPRSFKDLLRVLPFNGSGRGTLIGRIGDADIAQPFVLGASRDVAAPVGGRLALGINQASDDSADGSYTVHVEIYGADPSSGNPVETIAKKVNSISGVDAALFAKIPRRVSDKSGDPGDMVNFLILGSEDEMQKTFTAAGWVKVDADVKETLLRGVLDSLSKESYLTMPMSQLYLFGRPQDYGWAHAEPISVVRSRNHLRIWKATFMVNGQTLWIGAATHDIGFERDERNNGITHKIDPDIDLERDYVEKTLSSTGLVAEIAHILPENPMKEARTATGGSFHSNGEVLILKLVTGEPGSTSAQTANCASPRRSP